MIWRCFFFLIGFFLSYTSLAATLNVELSETSPASPAVLHQDEALYVLIRYKSEQPLRFQAMGAYLGKELKNNIRMNPSQAYPAGEGQAIAWVSYYKATKIDSVIVTVYNANWRVLETKSLSLSVTWQEDRSNVTQPKAPWVNELNQQQQASVTATQQPLSTRDILFIQLLYWSVPIYWILQLIILWKWSGTWRKIACIPLFISIPLLIYTLFALFVGSNLWPLMMLFITPVILLILLVIVVIKKMGSS
ncbi:hypothetical protein [Legionella parisiensis]|uniref:Uncharacterized protein n=1 Tax=Legionella parisiensis TaxID=45071 RepID=A0A1E5JMT9_9GAMM|nr:hypothetical protein [Legionella parisiensis]KTD42294.1 hypothetical protein Lpar_3611 [Legionella parisiensis]OEH45849.1 hypothetical protein lpari_03168 [Legionella parisiensis]STX72364.1 Uncharacterised protein [Legionella parisiensis]